MKYLAVVFILCFPVLAHAAPSIVFDTEMHDFGQVTQGDIVEYSFEFTNEGTDELIIQRIQTS